MQRLSDLERAWADTIARTLIPPGTAGGTVDGLDRGQLIADDIAASPFAAALLFRLSIWLIWLAPIFLAKGFHTFGSLADTAQRDAVLERLLAHRRYEVRMAANFFKLNVCALVLGERRFLARLGAYGLTDESAPDGRLLPIGRRVEKGAPREASPPLAALERKVP